MTIVAKEHYLHWAKVHTRVKYELTNSGVPSASLRDIDGDLDSIDLTVRGPYGHPDLIAAISERYRVAPERVVPVVGASAGLFVALATCMRHGERLATETPLYDPITRMADFLGVHLHHIVRKPNHGFAIDPDSVQNCLARGVRTLVLTNLHNPSGQLVNREAMADLAQRCASYGVMLVVDEVYLDSAHLNFGKPRWTAAALADNVVAINSLTKVHGLGALRVGWIIAPISLVEPIHAIVNLLNSDNPAPSEALALKAFARIDALEDRFRQFYRQGQDVFREWLAREPLVTGYPNRGALFECVRLPEGLSGDELNKRLVAEYDTQIVPGSFFGLDDHIRLTAAMPPTDLREALARISMAIRTTGRGCAVGP